MSDWCKPPRRVLFRRLAMIRRRVKGGLIRSSQTCRFIDDKGLNDSSVSAIRTNIADSFEFMLLPVELPITPIDILKMRNANSRDLHGHQTHHLASADGIATSQRWCVFPSLHAKEQ